jgi:hypothetical protein
MTNKPYRSWKVSVGIVKKVQGDDHLTMVNEEGEPAFGRIAAAPQALQISGDCALAEFEAGASAVPRESSVRPSPCSPLPCGEGE